jgi:hypothetical protein
MARRIFSEVLWLGRATPRVSCLPLKGAEETYG